MIAVEELPYKWNLDLYRSKTIEAQVSEWELVCEALALRLGKELRAAKSAQLSCGEVLLPVNLLHTVVQQILLESEREPCGLRGCTLNIMLETEDGSQVKIGSVKWDPQMSSTFQLSLTLRQDTRHKWGLSELLKTLTKGRTLIISDDFQLCKTRFYRPLAH